jgi:hypothetical protein
VERDGFLFSDLLPREHPQICGEHVTQAHLTL